MAVPMRRALLSAPLVAALAAVCAAAPSAGAVVETAGGLSYVTRQVQLDPQETRTATASCPAGAHTYGGGEKNASGFDTVTVRHSYPHDDADANNDPDDGWSAMIRNGSDSQRSASVIAICAAPNPTYRRTTFQALASTQTQTPEVLCPAGDRTYSGGESGSRRTAVSSSFPIDRPEDADTKPDDGWGVRIDNFTSQQRRITEYVICGNKSPSYPTTSANFFPNQTMPPDTACPVGTHVYGGGVKTSGGFGKVGVNTIAPFAATGAPDDRWRIVLDSHEASIPLVYHSHAICGPAL